LHPEFALILERYQSETQSTLYSLILVWGILKAKHIVFLQLETRKSPKLILTIYPTHDHEPSTILSSLNNQEE
jgi:hypothetical protein